MNQHTGNWPGKTVASAQGVCHYREKNYIFVDLPGTYSLFAHSAEEEVARDFICFGGADATVIVCDATCLERNLNLALQTIEITPHAVLCVNLLDEAEKKGIHLDLGRLQRLLGIPVVGVTARSRKGLDRLMEEVERLPLTQTGRQPYRVRYLQALESALEPVTHALEPLLPPWISARWMGLRLLEGDAALMQVVSSSLEVQLDIPPVAEALEASWRLLEAAGISHDHVHDIIASCVVLGAEELAMQTVGQATRPRGTLDRKLDRLFTSRATGIPIMLFFLCGILWLTIAGANYPSQLLSAALFWFQDRLTELFQLLHAPAWLHGALVLGVYRVLAWVVAVMLPPMAIFFPLFTLLEDFGYLPRIAFNLDHHFKKAGACGKQALTMCMGFGCNAVGVSGCRIIDSPRERLIAILTNVFVPCNGRFPTLIAMIGMFFAGSAGMTGSLLSALLLTGIILLGILLTLLCSRLLSRTALRGESSSFALELPPYRRPQIAQVLVRSVLDRTLFVLGRAVVVAAPAGLLIWMLANMQWGGVTLLTLIAGMLDPFAGLLGLDGVILLAFILGFPANEIVIPIILMAYMSTGTIVEPGSMEALRELLVSQGWTWTTAVSVALFSLAHWPCSTTCLTIRKETGSMKWTALAVLLPTVMGMVLCMGFTAVVRLLGF